MLTALLLQSSRNGASKWTRPSACNPLLRRFSPPCCDSSSVSLWTTDCRVRSTTTVLLRGPPPHLGQNLAVVRTTLEHDSHFLTLRAMVCGVCGMGTALVTGPPHQGQNLASFGAT